LCLPAWSRRRSCVKGARGTWTPGIGTGGLLNPEVRNSSRPSPTWPRVTSRLQPRRQPLRRSVRLIRSAARLCLPTPHHRLQVQALVVWAGRQGVLVRHSTALPWSTTPDKLLNPPVHRIRLGHPGCASPAQQRLPISHIFQYNTRSLAAAWRIACSTRTLLTLS